jgi:hypothetical protein
MPFQRWLATISSKDPRRYSPVRSQTPLVTSLEELELERKAILPTPWRTKSPTMKAELWMVVDLRPSQMAVAVDSEMLGSFDPELLYVEVLGVRTMAHLGRELLAKSWKFPVDMVWTAEETKTAVYPTW